MSGDKLLNNEIGVAKGNKVGVNDNNFNIAPNSKFSFSYKPQNTFNIYLKAECDKNIDQTLTKAVHHIANAQSISPEEAYEEFIKIPPKSQVMLSAIENSRFTNDETLQDIRARIIASEYQNPNGLSLRFFEEVKKLSTEEFLWFEENVAPFGSVLGYSSPLFIIDEEFRYINAVMNMNILTDGAYNFSQYIDIFQTENKKYIIYPYFINKSKISLSQNALEKLKGKIPVLNQFGTQLCKICEPKPWSDEYINISKAYLVNLGLKEGEDFKFEILLNA